MTSLGSGAFLTGLMAAPLSAGRVAGSGAALRLYHPPSAPRATSALGRFRCGLRGAGTRKPIWRSTVLSVEAIQTVQALKFARRKSSSPTAELEGALRDKVARLLKVDMMAVLAELQRQNEWELTLQVFECIRQEHLYQPDLSLYCDMIYMVGKNKLIELAERLFSEMKEDGLQPNTRAYNEMIGVYLKMGRLEAALDTYESLKESGCSPDELTFTILIRNLQKAGEHDIASRIMQECKDILEYPERFLKEVSKNYPGRCNLSFEHVVKHHALVKVFWSKFTRGTSNLSYEVVKKILQISIRSSQWQTTAQFHGRLMPWKGKTLPPR